MIRSNSHKEMNEYMEKYYKSIQSFSFSAPRILEREDWGQSKVIGIKRVKMMSKDDKGRFA